MKYRSRCIGLAMAAILLALPLQAQQAVISGRVVDSASGSPLAGVAVSVVGTGQGATTDAAGAYSIAGVAAGRQQLRAQRAGYAARTATGQVVAGRTLTVDFSLDASVVELEGVVAVGYGTQRRRDVTGSVTSVDVDDVRTAPVTTVDQVLQGRAAGVQVVQNNGAPGGGVSVRIRGTNSISANSSPLYVVDGVPAFVGTSSRQAVDNPLRDLNPNDIETIEVLKDASAAAIYGARGANGVVLITTKRGRRGDGIFQLESSYGVQDITRTLPVLSARQFAELHNEARVNARLAPAFTPEQVAGFGEGTDWQGELFRSAPIQNHALTVSGGDDKTRYLVTGSVFDQQGTIVGTDFDRYSVRLNLDREVNGRFRIGNNLSLSQTTTNVTPTDNSPSGGVITGVLIFSPTATVRDAEGRYTTQNPLNVPIANPIATASEIQNQIRSSRVVGNLFGEYDLADALKLRVSLGGNTSFARSDYYAPQTVLEGLSAGGLGRVRTSQARELLNENILTYQRAVPGGDLDLTTGFTIQNSTSDFLQGESQQFGTDVTGANNLGAGALPVSPGTGVNDWTLLSYLGRANYSIADRYLLTVTGRYDGSSRFGANNKWGFFPSAAFGWRVSEEEFLRDVEWVNDLKFRLSYGVTGNQEIGTYRSLAQLVDESYVLGNRQVVVYAPSGTAPNPDLRWETTRQFNAGADLSVLDGRVTVTADAYTGTTDDLLLEVPLPRTTGFVSRLRNVGSVENRGVELSLTTVNLERESLSWRTSFNVAMNRNEVVALGGSDRIFPAGARGVSNIDGGVTNVVQIGYPVGTLFGYRTDGIWQTGEAFASSGDPNAAPGEWKYVDVNGDGRITGDDRTVLGTAQPDFFGGFTNNLSYGPVTLDVFFQGSFGNEVANANAVFLKSVSTSTNEYASSYDRWTPQNPSNTVPRANLNRQRRLLDVYVEDGTYIRLQNLTLGVQLPAGLVPGAEQSRVYLSGQNLWTWTDYTGYDPEVSSYGGDASLRGVDFGQYPRSRTVNVGVNLTF